MADDAVVATVSSTDAESHLDVSDAVGAQGESLPQSSGASEGSPAPQGTRTGFDVALEALRGTPGSSQDDTSNQAPADAQSTDAAATDKPAGDDDVPFHKHPRWQEKLAAERDLRAQLTNLQPVAAQWSKIHDFLKRSNLTDQEFQEGLELLNWMKNDPQRMMTALAPYYDALRRASGEVLDQDLQKRVDDGLVDPETAKELQKARITAANLSRTVESRIQADQRNREEMVREDQRQQFEAFRDSVVRSVSEWEKKWQGRDPDYTAKQKAVTARITYMIQQDPPKSPEDCVRIAESALKEVNEEFAAIQKRNVRPIDTRRVNPANRTGGAQPAAAPKSGLDVARAALAATRAANA